MIEFKFDTTELKRKIRLSERAINIDIRRAVTAASKDALVKAKQGTFKDKTGNLRSSIVESEIGWTSQGYWRQVLSPAPYSVYVEYPTSPHPIWPKAAHGFIGPTRRGQTVRANGPGPHEYIVGRGYALRWVDGSGEHFARMVNHPGTRGYHYMSDASSVAHQTLINEFKRGFINLESVWIQ
jgi:hypothetical protein